MNIFKPIIVVVEDELIIADSIKEILEDEGYEVHSNITSYDKAVAAINLLKPQLVLIDINLNGLKDGIDVGHFLLSFDKIPFLYLTSISDHLTLDKVKETRPAGYILKPFTLETLKANVAIVLNNVKYKHIDVNRSNNVVLNDVSFKIKKVLQFIEQHLGENIDINQLAKLTSWKTDHFTRIFKAQMNVTPYNYILSKRISKAQILLSETKLTISEIASELGFSTHSSFSTAFKKAIHQTPETYRMTKFLR